MSTSATHSWRSARCHAQTASPADGGVDEAGVGEQGERGADLRERRPGRECRGLQQPVEPRRPAGRPGRGPSRPRTRARARRRRRPPTAEEVRRTMVVQYPGSSQRGGTIQACANLRRACPRPRSPRRSRPAGPSARRRRCTCPSAFGAHHWRVGSPAATVFATLDVLTATRDAASFEEAYAAAATLAEQGLDLVVAPRPTVAGGCTVPLGAGRLSCTPWLDATVVGDGPLTSRRRGGDDRSPARPPARRGATRAAAAVAVQAGRTARSARAPRSDAVDDRTVRERPTALRPGSPTWRSGLRTASVSSTSPRVGPTPGAAHANQLRTSTGGLVDWESVRWRPASATSEAWSRRVAGGGCRPQMLRLFELEWRLDEITQYATWFAAPHTGTADDTIARDGLLHEPTARNRTCPRTSSLVCPGDRRPGAAHRP